MNKKHIHFSLITCALCLGFLSDAVAAPSVKRLGGMNTYAGTSSAVSAKVGNTTKTNSGSRLSSVRTNRLTNAKGTVSTKTTASNAKANTSRLSVGQYLHNAGVVSGKINKIPSSGSSITPSELDDYAKKDEVYTKDEIDAKNYLTQTDVENTYVTKTEIQNNYYTTEQITNNYATKTEMNDMLDTVSNIDSRLTVVEQATGSSAGTVNDWNANKPDWANN